MAKQNKLRAVFVGQTEFRFGQDVILVLVVGGKKIACVTKALVGPVRIIRRVCGHLHRVEKRAIECAERNLRK